MKLAGVLGAFVASLTPRELAELSKVVEAVQRERQEAARRAAERAAARQRNQLSLWN